MSPFFNAMKNIEKPSRINMGGLRSIEVVSSSDVESISVPRIGKSTITLKAGKAFKTVKCTFNSRYFTDSQVNVGRSSVRDVRISCNVAGHDAAMLDNLKKYNGSGLIVVFEDYNNRKRIAGTIGSPMFFTYDFGSGTKVDDGSFTSITFYSKQLKSPPFI